MSAGAARAPRAAGPGRRRGLRGRGGRGGARPVATGELVFNTALSGYQEVMTDPSYAGQVVAFTYPHIGNYGTNPERRRGAPALLPRRGGARPGRGAEQLAVDRGARGVPGRRHGVPAITGVDTRRLTRHLRDHGAMPCAFGTRRRGGAARRRPPPPSPPTGATWCPRSPPPSPTCAATGPFRVVAYDFGVKETMLRQLGRAGHGHRGAGGDHRPTRCWPLEPDGVFLSNGPGDPAALPGPAAAVARPRWAGCRSSASASATSCCARRSAARPTSCPSATTAATTRSGTWTRPGGGDQPEPQLRRGRRARRRGDPRQPERRGGRGGPARRRPPPSRCSTTPRPAPGRTTPGTCSTSSAAAAWAARGRSRCRAATTSRSILVIGSGPDRDRPGLRVRLLGDPGLPGAGRGGLPGGAGQLQPGHDHDRPGRPPTAPTSSRSTPRCWRRSSSASAPTPCCPPWAARPRSTSPWSWSTAGALERGGGDRGPARGHPHGRGPRPVQGGHGARSAWRCRRRASPTRSTRRWPSPSEVGFPIMVRPSFILGGKGTGIAPDRDRLRPAGRRGPRRQPGRARSWSSGRSPAGRSTSSR